MVSKNNFKNKMEQTAARTPHYGIRKLSVGVASVLISTTLYMGATTAKADTLPSTAIDTATTKPEATSSSSSTQANVTADKNAKTTVPATASSTDTSVSTTPNAQASTINTTAGATSSARSDVNDNTLNKNNVESTANTTAQTQPKTDVVTSDKANVDNQVGSNVENKATTTADTTPASTAPKRVVRMVRSLAAAPTTNSKELVENQDYTVSNVSLEDHKKQDDFDQDATFLHADIKAKNGDVIANKEITFRFNSKEFRSFNNLKNQDLIYNDQVIGNITGVSDWNRVFKVASPKLHGYTADKDSVVSQAATNGENPVVTVTYSKNAPEKVTDQKVLSQTIRYQFSNGVPAHENHVQTVLVKRTGEKDAVSGEITWGPWDEVSFKAVKSPEIDGYEPDVKEVDAVRAVGNIDTDLTVTYHKVKDESATKSDQPENGTKTDQSEKGTKTPGGSVDTGKQPVKSDKNTGKSGEKISHDTSGVGQNDLNKPVTRTIKITDPQGKVTTETQTVHLTRTATVDEVTKEVTYSDWSTGKWDNYKIPVIEGYDSNVDQVDGQEVAFDTKNQTVEVSYTKLADSDRSTTPVKEENNTETPKQSQDKVQSKFVDTELPQTGEKQSKGTTIGAILVGLGSLLGLGALGKRKEK